MIVSRLVVGEDTYNKGDTRGAIRIVTRSIDRYCRYTKSVESNEHTGIKTSSASGAGFKQHIRKFVLVAQKVIDTKRLDVRPHLDACQEAAVTRCRLYSSSITSHIHCTMKADWKRYQTDTPPHLGETYPTRIASGC